jgi:3'-phosphoadenosine 5'-phosphosulfate (PAPS) 3'-phosphatase
MRELKAAIRIAIGAGRLLEMERGNYLDVEIKQDRSLCTYVDKLSSEYIAERLVREFPEHDLIDEERSDQIICPGPGRTWIVDPLESTISYIRGEGNYGVMIGLMEDNQPILGVTYRPAICELVYAVKGNGAFLEDRSGLRRLDVRASDELDILVSKYRVDPIFDGVIRNMRLTQVRGMPSSFKTIEVAKGCATAFICPPAVTMNTWDLCAPQIILEEAGGKISDIYGEDLDFRACLTNCKGVIASNGIVHSRIEEALKGIF